MGPKLFSESKWIAMLELSVRLFLSGKNRKKGRHDCP